MGLRTNSKKGKSEQSPADGEAMNLLAEVEKLRPGADLELIEKAFHFSARAHDGQLRLSGAPYLTHCVEVARILAELHLDSVTIAGGLLHDIVEDTTFGVDDIRKAFGNEIATIVDGVTNISGMSFDSPEQEQMEKYRKMLLSMAEDVRVILIKLADRLHNVRTLQFLPANDRKRIARETLEVFAPLAHRLGIAKVKWELEDLSLKHLDPEAYDLLAGQIAVSRRQREQYLVDLEEPLLEKLRENGIKAEIAGRAKHFYSIYMKMKNQGRPIEDIYDLLAIRVITDSVADCYKILGVIHGMYVPVIDRIKDFIATPKKNMYRSLHTTVIGPHGEMVEIQIRTREMHKTAEEGIAAHWRYKEGRKSDEELEKQLTWLRQTLEWSRDLTDPTEFMQSLRADLYHHEIFVFTPKGDLRNLPLGATPIDFAYAVHTEVGNHCTGAKVNGKLMALATEIKNGDTVEIMTQASAVPSIDWLKTVRTGGARSKIRRWLKVRGFGQHVTLGREMLEKQFKKARKPFPSEKEMADTAYQLKRSDAEHLFFSVGSGEISSQLVLHRIHPDLVKTPRIRKTVRPVKTDSGVIIQGMGDIMIRFAKCCQPVPGDEVVGLVTKGHGISVHRSTCHNVLKPGITSERLLSVDWDMDKDQAFPVEVSMLCEDRRNMLADVAKAIGDESADIVNADVKRQGAHAVGTFALQVKNLTQLNGIIKSIAGVKGVYKIARKGEVTSG
ncbi:MAG: bifunctional (p)ppGpp synthetase/guanosine-3',5'-bis(diphosphate) 3'-pyrophosphohydrolase [Candidatus Eisenbacteria bacterium]